jgi:hypothetical protein
MPRWGSERGGGRGFDDDDRSHSSIDDRSKRVVVAASFTLITSGALMIGAASLNSRTLPS